jgi:hypothetical protein
MSWQRKQNEKRKLNGQKDWTREQKAQVKEFLKQYPQGGQDERQRKAG